MYGPWSLPAQKGELEILRTRLAAPQSRLLHERNCRGVVTTSGTARGSFEVSPRMAVDARHGPARALSEEAESGRHLRRNRRECFDGPRTSPRPWSDRLASRRRGSCSVRPPGSLIQSSRGRYEIGRAGTRG